jgi:hypothetical protein
VADLFAKFFREKIDALAANSTIRQYDEPEEGRTPWNPFTVEEVKNALENSKSKKSTGQDDVPMLIVKHCSDVLKGPLMILFNKCMDKGWFPEDWKVAKVIPIHKKGDKSSVTNYRPISNLCALSKILERCVLQRLEAFDLDDLSQHGFRPHHSTTTAALEVQHHVASALDRKMKVCAYSVDMSAAFDLLRPEVLNAKLESIPVKLRVMIQEFLKNRRAYVCIDGENSMVYNIPVGVPQGSVLGPKLFTLYTAGLSDLIGGQDEHSKIVVYADDSYVIVEGRTVEELRERLKSTLDRHMTWLRNLGMIVNSSKTELLIFDKNETLEIQCEGNTLKSTAEMNVLGITFDNCLTWEAQVRNSMRSCQRFKPALRLLRSKLSKKELLQVITSHYYSRLYYGCEVWHPVLNSRLKTVMLPVHYYPLRLVMNDFRKQIPKRDLCKLTKRASPDELINLRVSKMMISIANNACPYVLFNEMLSHAIQERRRPYNPSFLDMSRTRIGRQSFANRLSHVSKKIKFEWLSKILSKPFIIKSLKETFFAYAH